MSGDAGTVTVVAGSGVFASKDVGSRAVAASGYSITGANASRYALSGQPSVPNASITAKALTVTGLSANDKFYDGTTAATLGGSPTLLAAAAPGSGNSGDGKPYTGDAVSAGGTASGVFAHRDPGTWAVTLSGVTLAGADAGNYTLALPSLTGVISPIKTDAGVTTITAANENTFNLTLNNGRLQANHPAGQLNGQGTIEVNNSATLGGAGTLGGAVIVNTGGTLAPGESIGTLTVNNTLTLDAASTTSMELDALTPTNDVVVVGGALTYGGTLSVTNVAGTLAAGQSFPLFSAASASGNFSDISPATPGPGLGWNFNPTNGLLSVVSLVVPTPNISGVTVADGQLIFSVTNGTPGATARVLASTNIALPMATWTAVSTNVFDGTGKFSATNAVTANPPQRFYRIAVP